MPTGGDATLDSHRAVLVASLISGLKIDFGQIIDDELFVRAHKVASALPLPCLITELCRQANVPLIRGIDNEVRATHRQDIEKSKDDSKFEMWVNKPPAYQTQSAPAPDTSEIPKGMPLPIATYVLPDYVPPSTSAGSGSMPPTGGADYAEYRLTQENFAKSVKLQKKFQKQLDTWASQFKLLLIKL